MRRRKVKRLFFVFNLLLIFSLLIGCAGKPSEESDNSSGKVKITFSGWGEPEEKQIYQDLIKKFESENPDIVINYVHIPADYAGKMNTVLAGGNAPDVFYVGDDALARWGKMGLLMNIEEKTQKSDLDLDDMWESAVNRYRFDGSKSGTGDLYALPMDIAPTVLYYNKKLFDEANVPYPSAEEPMTWEQLVEVGKKLTKDKNGDGEMDQFGIGPLWWEGFVWGNGGKILSDDKSEFLLNSPEATEALQFAADVRNVHKISPSSRALKSMNDGQMFETGRLAMQIQGRYMVPAYRKLNFDWDVAPLPTGGEWSGWSASAGFGIYSKTKHPDEAFKFAEFIAGPESNKIRSEAGLNMPVYKSMANSDVFLNPDKKPEHSEVYLEAANHQQAGPWTYVPNNKWLDILNQNLGKIWDGKKTTKELMDELKPKIDKALKEGNPELYK
jgi:multiple sugar transport system substrate-binding protein